MLLQLKTITIKDVKKEEREIFNYLDLCLDLSVFDLLGPGAIVDEKFKIKNTLKEISLRHIKTCFVLIKKKQADNDDFSVEVYVNGNLNSKKNNISEESIIEFLEILKKQDEIEYE